MLGLAASFLAGCAALVASQTADEDFVPFFVGLSFLGGVAAWATREPQVGRLRTIARGVAVVWLIAAVWVGVLLAWEASYYGASRPPAEPTRTYLGIPVTAYHVIGLYGGALLVIWSAFRPVASRVGEDDDASVAPRTP